MGLPATPVGTFVHEEGEVSPKWLLCYGSWPRFS